MAERSLRRERDATNSRVDQPLAGRRAVKLTPDAETVGRLSERIARFLGSWRFIGYMTAFIMIWVAWNTWGPKSWRFDEWQFIGLTLLLSLQASYAAPLILLAANRQADRDRVQYNEDRTRDDRMLADVEFLAREVAALRIAIGEVATRDFVRSELRDISDQLDLLQDEPDEDAPQTSTSTDE